ncbi:MAG: transporter substrate-binding domain-containing protein [Rhodospirillales bacterium]|nr:transporter substrate-binding domain-containing protein [Rhodospirillales bacterium]
MASWLSLFGWRWFRIGLRGLFFPFLVYGLLHAGALSAEEHGSPSIELTPAEKAWLAEHPEIRLAVDIDWAPFEYVDDSGRYTGMAAEFIRLVEKRLGITFSIDTERPWPQMVEAVRKRELDAFSLVVRTPQRDEFVNFTEPYISFPMVIVTLEDEPFIDGLDRLRNRTVSVVESYASHDLLAENHSNQRLHLAKSVRSGLEAVSTGQVYAFVGNLAVISQVIRDAGIANLKISGQTPYRSELSMAVRKDWPELVPILQKALDSIDADTRDQIHDRWIRLRFQQEVDYRIVFAVVGVGLVILFMVLVWNRRLRLAVKHRQQAERELANERQRLAEIIWGTNIGTWEWNVQTGETVFNERWAEIVGYTLDELAPISIETWMRLAHPDDLARSGELLEKNFSGELDHYECEARMRHKNGDWIWVRDRGKVVEWTEDGKPLRMSGTHSDITGQKKLDRMKDEFVSTVSHELRTPLTSIKGSLGLVAGGALGGLPGKARDMVDVAYRNADRLIALVNDILDIEKLDSGRMAFEFETLNLSSLVRETIDANIGLASQHGVEFILADQAPDTAVRGDDSRLAQVISNLLSNAAKFSDEGGRVEVSIACQNGTARVSVADQGRGIPDEFREHVFERFAQADAADDREKGGTGLGLSISKSIIEKHGGAIDFDSRAGVGTTFYFTLPVRE